MSEARSLAVPLLRLLVALYEFHAGDASDLGQRGEFLLGELVEFRVEKWGDSEFYGFVFCVPS
jgi:hypothetical protein